MTRPSPTVLIHHPRANRFGALLRKAAPEIVPLLAEKPADLGRSLPEAEILICAGLSAHDAATAAKLRWIQLTSAGVDLVLDALPSLGDVTVTNARGVHAELMSDHALAAMVMLQWDFPRILQDQAARRWRREPKRALAGQTLAVVGAGAIGGEIGRRASQFGMRVLGVRRSGEPLPGFDAMAMPSQLDEVLAQAEFVCVTSPATSETRALFGARRFANMRPGAFFINISRGSVVDETALIDALRLGRLGGAALDVFEKEPPDADNPLWSMPNVIMTPHLSGMLDTYEERVVEIFVDNYRRYASGDLLRNRVDLERGY
jgi:phosphoglycerate dehydrogenase-like enzyme